MEKIRISKYFSMCGIMSRRAAEAEIEAGKVYVNKQVARLGQSIDPNSDIITYKGKTIKPATGKKICIMLNKPRGIVCTARDEKGRTCITELCRVYDGNHNLIRLYPIGRLDMDSDGLILLTNDGELTNILTHPRHSIPKIYHVTLNSALSDSEIKTLGEPILIDGRYTSPADTVRLEEFRARKDTTIVKFTLFEGRNRQIRRMCESHGYEVLKLTRTAIGDLKLENLPAGKWRTLTENEINYLKGQTN